jgi:hypothetical protein
MMVKALKNPIGNKTLKSVLTVLKSCFDLKKINGIRASITN